MHEASLYESNCFITLTYANEHLPEYGTLVPRDFQLFMKRLREKYAPHRIRFFQCGEYGSRTKRPHYHALLFNFDFRDKRKWCVRNGLTVFRSASLEELWPFGQSEIGSVTFESASYVARYVVDKVSGRKAREEHYSRVNLETGEIVRIEPEFSLMSRRPGIASEWFKRFGKEVYPADSVIARGVELKPPRYYDGLFELENPEGWKVVKRKRRKAEVAGSADSTDQRLWDRELVARSQVATFAKDEI